MAALTNYWEKQAKPTPPASPLPTYFDPAGGGPGTPPAGPAKPTGNTTTTTTPEGGGQIPVTPPKPTEEEQKKLYFQDFLKLLGLYDPQQEEIEDIMQQIEDTTPDEKLTTEEFFNNPDISQEVKQQVADALGVTIEEAIELYAGYPIVSGYFDPATGEFVLGNVFTMVKRLKELADLSSSVPGLDEWQAEQGYDLSGISGKMGDLADLMAGGVNDEDVAASRQWQAENMGFDSFEAYQEYLQTQLGRSQEGLTEQEQADWDRATEIQVRQMREDKMGMIESMGMESTGRMYREMDQISLNMSDARASREYQKLEADMAKEQIAFQQYMSMAQMGTGQQQIYHDMAFQNRMGALEAYSQQATMIMNQYRTDLEGMQIHANMMYQSIMADMGYEQFITDQILAEYELELMPLLTELELAMAEMELNPTKTLWDYMDYALKFLPILLG